MKFDNKFYFIKKFVSNILILKYALINIRLFLSIFNYKMDTFLNKKLKMKVEKVSLKNFY